MNIGHNESVDDFMNAWTIKWSNKWKNDRTNERMPDSLNNWMHEFSIRPSSATME